MNRSVMVNNISICQHGFNPAKKSSKLSPVTPQVYRQQITGDDPTKSIQAFEAAHQQLKYGGGAASKRFTMVHLSNAKLLVLRIISKISLR